jgi:hypothetical protein
MDGMERFACPTPDRQGRYRCIDDHVLCDGFIDCPEGEDEDRQACMFYKTVSFFHGCLQTKFTLVTLVFEIALVLKLEIDEPLLKFLCRNIRQILYGKTQKSHESL